MPIQQDVILCWILLNKLPYTTEQLKSRRIPPKEIFGHCSVFGKSRSYFTVCYILALCYILVAPFISCVYKKFAFGNFSVIVAMWGLESVALGWCTGQSIKRSGQKNFSRFLIHVHHLVNSSWNVHWPMTIHCSTVGGKKRWQRERTGHLLSYVQAKKKFLPLHTLPISRNCSSVGMLKCPERWACTNPWWH